MAYESQQIYPMPFPFLLFSLHNLYPHRKSSHETRLSNNVFFSAALGGQVQGRSSHTCVYTRICMCMYVQSRSIQIYPPFQEYRDIHHQRIWLIQYPLVCNTLVVIIVQLLLITLSHFHPRSLECFPSRNCVITGEVGFHKSSVNGARVSDLDFIPCANPLFMGGK